MYRFFPSFSYSYSIVVIITHSKSVRRNIKSLINSTRNLFELLLFVLAIVLFFAIIGYRIIGDLDHDAYHRTEEGDQIEVVNFK
jgi:hypothetical protein